ncbi:TraB family protein [Ruegeria denitrificans]|uniref:TraB family protein n=1 Tax=Ruegeria denitrificans TaxID=1715692 RepID=A0A0P1I1G7_9RHOB|nr:TraB/GumN family protein [Ruegeria denitrificans]CUJ84443.1 TraB family protein [Ruegeria denitrificans]
MRLFLFLIGLLLPATAHAACEGRDLREDFTPEIRTELDQALIDWPYPEGNHWVATKGNAVLHLIGTLHVNYPRMDAIVARLTPTLSQVDAFYFEVTQDEMKAWEKELALDPSPILITSGPTLIDLLPEEEWATLSSAMVERGIPSWMGAKMRPWFLGMTLAMPACLMQDPTANHGLDARLTEVAEAYGIQQFSLESIKELMAMFEIHTIEEQAESLARMVNAYENTDDQMATMANAYFDENHAQSMELGRIIAREASGMAHEMFDAEWNAFEQHLLIERNNNWMPRILEIQDQTAVIAVGAGHLSGPHGLLNQLQRAGYTLSRAPF